MEIPTHVGVDAAYPEKATLFCAEVNGSVMGFGFGIIAVLLLTLACESPRQKATDHYTLGLSHLRSGTLTQAVGEFQAAVAADPSYADAHYELGVAYLMTTELAMAGEEFRKAVGLNPRHSLACYQLGRLYYNPDFFTLKTNRELALDLFRKTIEIDSQKADAYIGLGDVYSDPAVDKMDEAVKAYEKALSIEPHNGVAHYGLAVCYYQQGVKKLAVEHCSKVKELGYKPSSGRLIRLGTMDLFGGTSVCDLLKK